MLLSISGGQEITQWVHVQLCAEHTPTQRIREAAVHGVACQASQLHVPHLLREEGKGLQAG